MDRIKTTAQQGVCYAGRRIYSQLHIAISPYPADGILSAFVVIFIISFSIGCGSGYYKIPAQQQALSVSGKPKATFMDIILERANRFAKNHFRHDTVPQHKGTLDSVNQELNSIDNPLDKIKFINIVIEANNKTLISHKLKCTNPECAQDFEHGNIQYFLTQELNRLGVYLNEDTFTDEEKEKSESKLDQILRNLNDLKLGQQIIYEDLVKEINDLRELYFLGKKKWHQLFLGKCVDMVASGIVSETVSKQIVDEFSKTFPSFLT